MRIRLLPLAALLACSGSAGEAPAPDNIYTSAFVYHASSASGQPLLTGQIDLRVAGDSTVSGSWNIHWAPGADQSIEVGPQVGFGELTGSLSGSDVFLHLNPGMYDNNVFLRATRGPQGLTGRWEWSTFAGVSAAGTFQAIRSDSLPTPR